MDKPKEMPKPKGVTKYSKSFERDFDFYFRNAMHFKFCGTQTHKYKAVFSANGVSAKEAFYNIESKGENTPTTEPYILDMLLLTKASVNFQIKQWAEDRASGYLSKIELSQRLSEVNVDDLILTHTQSGSYYFKDLETYYGLPEWVLNAVENQKKKIWAS